MVSTVFKIIGWNLVSKLILGRRLRISSASCWNMISVCSRFIKLTYQNESGKVLNNRKNSKPRPSIINNSLCIALRRSDTLHWSKIKKKILKVSRLSCVSIFCHNLGVSLWIGIRAWKNGCLLGPCKHCVATVKFVSSCDIHKKS